MMVGPRNKIESLSDADQVDIIESYREEEELLEVGLDDSYFFFEPEE